MDDVEYCVIEGDVVAVRERALPLCQSVIPGFLDAYLLDRLAILRDPLLIVAVSVGCDVGFKLGYVREPRVFYSWLGGVRAEARRQGIATGLMTAQHLLLERGGYVAVETRCRAANNPMIQLNLRHGFHVSGFEVDAERGPVVQLRRDTGTRA
ncbi:hypothetical protein [Sphingomonas sp. UYP23]